MNTATTCREIPILFTGPMVRAILEGRKTQTRRIVQNLLWDDDHNLPCMIAEDGPLAFPERFYDGTIKCPYGSTGDRLWVREAWAHIIVGNKFNYLYRADHHTGIEKKNGDQKWKPSIHMPKVACRLMLEVTSVRVERVQEITDADCRNESCCHRGWDATDWKHPHNENGWSIERANFASLWSTINGPDSWTSNPFVWVIEFRRLN